MARGGLLVAASALLAGGCAPSLRVLAGAAEQAPIGVRAQATLHRGGDAAVEVAIENAGEDPVGIEVDAIVLRDAAGKAQKVLGRLQKFRGAAAREEVRRVPHGAATVEPHATAKLSLEFSGVASGVAARLAVPSLLRLGIDGQKPLAAVEVPLAFDAKETAAAVRAAFPDPFVEE